MRKCSPKKSFKLVGILFFAKNSGGENLLRLSSEGGFRNSLFNSPDEQKFFCSFKKTLFGHYSLLSSSVDGPGRAFYQFVLLSIIPSAKVFARK